MPAVPSVNSPPTPFDELRAALVTRHHGASPGVFTLAEESVVRSGFGELDVALGGGVPRGAISTLEGVPGSGRSALAARLLAQATADGGLGALIELPAGWEGTLYPPALAAAGVDLERLLIVHPADVRGVGRAVDIVLRSVAFGVVVMPAVALQATAWTRLGSLTHRANAVLVALGEDASPELRYFASLRIRLRAAHVGFAGESGLFGTLAGMGIEAAILKHKRAAPGKHARFMCVTFESPEPPLGATRQQNCATFTASGALGL